MEKARRGLCLQLNELRTALEKGSAGPRSLENAEGGLFLKLNEFRAELEKGSAGLTRLEKTGERLKKEKEE